MVTFKAQAQSSAAVVPAVVETPELPNISGDELASQAFDLGGKVGEACENAFNRMIAGKEDWEGGPFRVMFGLQNDLTEAQLDALAIPYSDTGINPDEYKVSKEDKNGKVKLVASDFYRDFARGTPACQNMLSRIEMCERAGDLKAIKDDIPADIIALATDAHRLETHVAFLKNRVKQMPKAYRQAAELLFQFNAINAYPNVAAEPVWAQGKSPSEIKEGELPEVENTTLTVMVWLKPEEGKPVMKSKQMTKGEFLRLDAKRGIEKGGTFNSLLETAVNKKAAGSGSNSNNDDAFVIKTIDRGVEVLAEFHRWSTEIETAKDRVEYGKLIKLGNTKDNDEYVTAIVEVRNFLDELIKIGNLGDKYTKLQQGGSELVKETTKTAA